VLVAALAEIKPAQLSQASSINSVVRSVSSALAVGLVSTLVATRTTFHYAHLAEQVTAGSLAGQALQQEATYLVSQGMTQQNALLVATEQIIKQLQQQAYLLAMNDAFLISLGVVSVTVFIVLFTFRSPHKKATIAPQGKKPGSMAAGGKQTAGSAASEADEEHIMIVH